VQPAAAATCCPTPTTTEATASAMPNTIAIAE
jgi:hypothetical protein